MVQHAQMWQPACKRHSHKHVSSAPQYCCRSTCSHKLVSSTSALQIDCIVPIQCITKALSKRLWTRYCWRNTILVIVGGMWCVEEVSDLHGQETRLKYNFDSSKKKWTFGSGSLLCQRFRRRREETAWKRRRIETSPVIMIITLRALSSLFLVNSFGHDLESCNLYLKRFDLTEGLLFDTFLITAWNKLCTYDHSRR